MPGIHSYIGVIKKHYTLLLPASCTAEKTWVENYVYYNIHGDDALLEKLSTQFHENC